MTERRLVGFVVFLFAVTTLLPMAIAAQTGSVDLTFNAIPTNPPGDINFEQIIQPDGKIIVYKAPSIYVNGVVRSGIFRLNTDGSIDPTFTYNNDAGVSIRNIMLAPDGKIILAGSTAPNHAKMARLNPDGSVDPTFSVQVNSTTGPEFGSTSFVVNAVLADGKVIATRGSSGLVPGSGTWTSYGMARYSVTGTVDSSFSAPSLPGGHLYSTSTLIEMLPDGRYYLGVSTGNHIGRSITITRRLADGTVDPTFVTFTRTMNGLFIQMEDLAVTGDGGVLVTGVLWPASIGFPLPQQLLKIFPDGTVDSSFSAPVSQTGSGVHQLPDGKVLYSLAAPTLRPLIRLNTNGSVDNTFVLDPVITSIKNTWRPDHLNRPVFLAQTSTGSRLVRLLDSGAIDPSFNPVIGIPGNTSLLAAQTDGKVIVSGNFGWMNGLARTGFARLNTDGSVDTSFDPGGAFNNSPRELLIQPDGKILAVGWFSTYNGTPVTGVVRINTNGSLDNTFSVNVSGSNNVDTVALQSDGKILIGGTFGTVNGATRTGLVRVDSSGALDTSFNPVIGSPAIKEILVEPSGKITIGGQFSGVNGVGRLNLARLESTGATDAGFDAAGIALTHGLWQQPDGKYLVTSGPAPQLTRRNSDGSPDGSFTPPTFLHNGSGGYIEDVLILPDGSMLVGGEFNSVGGFSIGYITRLRTNGTLDSFFLPAGANARVTSIVSAQTGKATVAGIFNSIGDVSRFGIARLNVLAYQLRTPFDFDGDGKADISVYRPSSGVWYQLFSGGGAYGSPTFGLAGDIPVPADFDGDGKTDTGIFRPSTGDWWYRASSDQSIRGAHFGAAGDIPLPADIDNDGKADLVVFRPANNNWYRITAQGTFDQKEFGSAGDKPVIGDFDGDGKADQAIFRPSTGDWWYAASSAGGAFRAVHWGQNGDIPAPADFDGDGKTDTAVFRPSNGAWYILKSTDLSFIITQFGVNGDRPVPADYDGDGRADIAVYRPSTGVWYLLQTTAGSAGVHWGLEPDVAIPNAFVQP